MRKRWDGMFALIATALTFVIALCLPAILVNTHRLVLALMVLSVWPFCSVSDSIWPFPCLGF
jgi:hypothetical protein